VDSQTQKRRDLDRMQILTDEIRTEENKLAELKKEYQNGEPERLGSERNYAKYQERVATMKDDIARTEKNIEALKREIGQLK
jgi:ubiquinone biosynthesis protein UbiJ